MWPSSCARTARSISSESRRAGGDQYERDEPGRTPKHVRVGDLDRPRGVVDAREKPHEQRAEDLARRLEGFHEPHGEGDQARGLARHESRGDAVDVVGHLRAPGVPVYGSSHMYPTLASTC